MRILTEEQALERLTASKNVARSLYTDRVEIENAHSGGGVRTPIEIRAMCAASVQSGMKIADVGNLFGIHKSSVAKWGNNQKVSTSGNVVTDRELESVMKPAHEKASAKAADLMMQALEHVGGKFADPKNRLRDITGAAKDLASTIEKISPKGEDQKIAAVVLMGTAPYQAERYKVIETSAVLVK